MCYPRLEVGQPTVCSETCVGRLRYLGLFLYDADKVLDAASTPDEKDLYQAQLDLLLDPNDPAVIEQARKDGIEEDWIEAAQKSPVYRLAKEFKVALPLHPEYRTMPMVWYIPPLSPIVDALSRSGHDAEDHKNLFGAIDSLRIPVEYLANLMTAGDAPVVRNVLAKLAAMRSYMRDYNLGKDFNKEIPESVGMTGESLYDMYRLLAIAKYEDRYVIPVAHKEVAAHLDEALPGCSVDFESWPGGPVTPVGESRVVPVAIESFQSAKQRAEAETNAELERDQV